MKREFKPDFPELRLVVEPDGKKWKYHVYREPRHDFDLYKNYAYGKKSTKQEAIDEVHKVAKKVYEDAIKKANELNLRQEGIYTELVNAEDYGYEYK